MKLLYLYIHLYCNSPFLNSGYSLISIRSVKKTFTTSASQEQQQAEALERTDTTSAPDSCDNAEHEDATVTTAAVLLDVNDKATSNGGTEAELLGADAAAAHGGA